MPDEVQSFFREYGLWAVFFFTMIEGDLTLLLAGVAARSGLFSFQDALLVGTTGGVAGDLVGYLIGRIFRSRARTLRFYMRAKPRIERLMRRFGGFTLRTADGDVGLLRPRPLRRPPLRPAHAPELYGVGRHPRRRRLLLH